MEEKHHHYGVILRNNLAIALREYSYILTTKPLYLLDLFYWWGQTESSERKEYNKQDVRAALSFFIFYLTTSILKEAFWSD